MTDHENLDPYGPQNHPLKPRDCTITPFPSPRIPQGAGFPGATVGESGFGQGRVSPPLDSGTQRPAPANFQIRRKTGLTWRGEPIDESMPVSWLLDAIEDRHKQVRLLSDLLARDRQNSRPPRPLIRFDPADTVQVIAHMVLGWVLIEEFSWIVTGWFR